VVALQFRFYVRKKKFGRYGLMPSKGEKAEEKAVSSLPGADLTSLLPYDGKKGEKKLSAGDSRSTLIWREPI